MKNLPRIFASVEIIILIFSWINRSNSFNPSFSWWSYSSSHTASPLHFFISGFCPFSPLKMTVPEFFFISGDVEGQKLQVLHIQQSQWLQSSFLLMKTSRFGFQKALKMWVWHQLRYFWPQDTREFFRRFSCHQLWLISGFADLRLAQCVDMYIEFIFL